MIELIVDLKNNKKKRKLESISVQMTTLKKTFSSVTGSIRPIEALRVSLLDILSVETKGKWWLVGSGWKGSSALETAPISSIDSSTTTASLIDLARKQRMNTELRKAIFVVIMGAEDCVDAYERFDAHFYLQIN